MQITKEELEAIIGKAIDATVKKLIKKGFLVKQEQPEKKNASSERTAYQKTEQLLFNYNNFKKILRAKEQEIEDIRKYGVLQGGGAVVQYGGNTGGKPQGIVLDEERVEKAVENVEKSMESIVQAIAQVDAGMATLTNDPYYTILEMRYFEGRTQEDIAIEFDCTQQNIAYHKGRLVKELAVKLFPDQVVAESLR